MFTHYNATLYCRGFKKRQRLLKDHRFELEKIEFKKLLESKTLSEAAQVINKEMRQAHTAHIILRPIKLSECGTVETWEPFCEHTKKHTKRINIKIEESLKCVGQ